MFEDYKVWSDVPLDVREKVTRVVFANKINFDENQIRFVRVAIWDYFGKSDNGRMVDENKTCTGTYRIPDIDNFCVYVTPMPNKEALLIDFCDREANANMTQFVYINGGVRR